MSEQSVKEKLEVKSSSPLAAFLVCIVCGIAPQDWFVLGEEPINLKHFSLTKDLPCRFFAAFCPECSKNEHFKPIMSDSATLVSFPGWIILSYYKDAYLCKVTKEKTNKQR